MSETAMFNFTPRAQEALALAAREASRLNHNFVGTEHILLGLMNVKQGVAFHVLQKMGLDTKAIRQEIEDQIGTGPTPMKDNWPVPYTPRVRKVMALATKEAGALNHNYIGTGDILLALLREGDGVAAKVLKQHAVELARTRQEIANEKDPKVISSEHSPASSELQQPGQPGKPDASTTTFTPRAQQVLALARKEADQFQHSFVGAEHLLLGLIKLNQGVAVTVLAKLGLDFESVHMEIKKQLGTRLDQKLSRTIPYTPQVRNILVLATREARALNHSYVGTEHLLLGLLRDNEGFAALIFKHFKVDTVQTRLEILRELDPNFGR